MGTFVGTFMGTKFKIYNNNYFLSFYFLIVFRLIETYFNVKHKKLC